MSPSRRPAFRLPLACAAAGAALLTATPGASGAQAVLGVGEDALVLPKGVFRLRAVGQQGRFDERFGSISTLGIAPNRREPVLQDLNIQSIGTVQFPNLAPVEAGLRGLTGITDYSLSLGRTTATGDVRINAGTLVLEAGLTKRLSAGVQIPFVSTRNNVNLRVNPNGEGNVGFNPGIAGGAAAARDQNTALVGQLLTAARAVEAQLGLTAGACATSTSPQCQSVQGVRTFAGGIGAIYGANPIPTAGYAGATGSPFAPLTGSAAQTAIATRIQGIKTALGPAGALITTNAPFASPQNLQLADAQRILTEQAFGVVAAPVGTANRSGLGDIEFGAKYSLVNTFGHDDPNARLTPSGVNFRTAVAGAFRVGTGLAEDPRNFLDVPTGTGANAIGLRSSSDLLVGSRFWSSLALRYTVQLPDDQLVRITDVPERVLAAQYRQQFVRRNLGDFFELEATPRFVLTNWLAVAGQYYFRNKQRDNYAGQFTIPGTTTGFGDLTLDARTLNQETVAIEHRVGGGLSLSSVQPFTAGRFPVPAELTYTLQQAVSGYGGGVPRITLHQVQARLYYARRRASEQRGATVPPTR
jgi:hypothetical protein